MERQDEIYKLITATSYSLGTFEEFADKNKKDLFEAQDWSICMGAMTLLDSLDFEEALEVAEKVSNEEIFCEAQYFLDYVSSGELVVFQSIKDFFFKANLTVPCVIYKLSTEKIIQIFK